MHSANLVCLSEGQKLETPVKQRKVVDVQTPKPSGTPVPRTTKRTGLMSRMQQGAHASPAPQDRRQDQVWLLEESILELGFETVGVAFKQECSERHKRL